MNPKLITPSAEAEDAVLPSMKVPEPRLGKILVATDFSECSRKAFEYGVSLARQHKAEFVVLHVLEPAPPQVAILEATMETTLREDASKQLEQWRERVSSEVNASVVLREGTPAYKQIVAVAKEVDAGLIIVGNHGRNALGRLYMGTTAEKVVRFAPCPVLVIRERERDFVAQPEG